MHFRTIPALARVFTMCPYDTRRYGTGVIFDIETFYISGSGV